MMKSVCGRLTWVALGVVGGVAGVCWWLNLDEPAEPPLSPPLLVPVDARPGLVSAAVLPAARGGAYAKPVVAADAEGRTVVAQELGAGVSSRIVQWRNEGGRGWSEGVGLVNSPADESFVGDPWLTTDRRQRFCLVHIGLNSGTLMLRRSTDGAKSWLPPQRLTEGADRPVIGSSPDGRRLVIAAGLARRKGPQETLRGDDPQLREKVEAAVSYSAGVFVSRNRGRSWEQLPAPLGEAHSIPFSAAIDDGGRIVGAWISRPRGADARTRSVVCSISDGGRSWIETELVADLQSDRKHPFNGARFPVAAVSARGVAHVAYVDSLGTELCSRRRVNGESWASAVRHSSEAAEEVRLPAIGTWGTMVHLTWMERRADRWQLHYRGSRDDGETWSERLVIADPETRSAAVDGQGCFLSSDDDQTSIVDDGAGSVHIVWSARPSGSAPPQIRYAIVRWRLEE
jgi:hypothetical protein